MLLIVTCRYQRSLMQLSRWSRGQILRPLRSIRSLLESGLSKYEPSIKPTITVLAGLSPLFVSACIKLFDLKITLGDLFKRNGIDSINETFDVTREVGSLELKKALDVFVESIPENKTIILVIDNIDRVEADKVKEIWSDLSIISTLSGQRLRVIVPFSEIHIAKALSDEGDKTLSSGREYIIKRLPLIFRAPPVITAGWREQFYRYWDESIGHISGKLSVAELIDIWKPIISPITPRLLKRLINDIGSSHVSCPESQIDGLSCAVYHIVYKRMRPSLTINQLLSESSILLEGKTTDNQEEDTHNDQKAIDSRLSETFKLLNRVFTTRDLWAGQLACLHFQTNLEIARSELLVEPIRSAMNGKDAEAILSLSEVIGFDIFFKKQLQKTDPEDAYNLAFEVFRQSETIEDSDDNKKKICDDWIIKWLPVINDRNKIFLKSIDRGNSAGMFGLIDAGLEVDKSRIEKDFKLISDGEAEFNKDNCDWLYNFSRIVKLKPKQITQPDSKSFYEIIWPFKEKYE